MALSYVTITELAEDGSAASLNGTATFTPNQAAYSASNMLVIADVPIVAQVVGGQLLAPSGGPLQLLATDNTLTFLSLTGFLEWSVELVLSGVEQQGFSFFLPSSPSSVDLLSLANTSAGGGGGGSGTVTSVSVATANGLAGTVANPSTTPAITLRTTVTGIAKGNGTAFSAAASGTDYAPATSGSAILKGDGAGGFASAASGTDYAPATSGSSILKGNGSGGFSAAVPGTDYLAPAGNGSSLTGLAVSQVSGAAPLASPTFTGTVTVPTTVNATDAAQKAYVDSVAQGLDNKPSVTVLASANITLSGTQTIDGVGVVAGNRVLATGQSTASQNGIWTVASGAWTRPVDFASGSVQLGASVFVEGGTANGSSGWVLTGTSAVTVDTSSQTWTQFSGAGEVTAGTGLTKNGNTLSLTVPVTIALGGTGQTTQQAALDALAGAVTSGLYMRGNGTHVLLAAIQAADVPQLADYAPTGLTGATAASRYAGATASGSPGSGTFATGDFVVDQSGKIWVCTAGGTPGTWTFLVPASGATLTGKIAPKVVTLTDGASVALDASLGNVFRWPLGAGSHTLAAPSNPVDGQMIRVRIIYSGSFTPLFNAAYEFGTDGQPSWTASSGKIDSIGFEYDADANSSSGAWTCAGWKLGYV